MHVDVGEEARPVGRVDHRLGIGREEAADALASAPFVLHPVLRADEHLTRVLLRGQEEDVLVEQTEVAHDLVKAMLSLIVRPLHRDVIELRLIDDELPARAQPAHHDAHIVPLLREGHGLLAMRHVHPLHEIQEAHAERVIGHAQAVIDLLLVADADLG